MTALASSDFKVEEDGGIRIGQEMVPAPAFATMLAVLGIDALLFSGARVVRHDDGSGDFSIIGSANLLGTPATDVSLHLVAEEGYPGFGFQFTATLGSLTLHTLAQRGIISPDRNAEVRPVLDLVFTGVDLVFDSDRHTLFLGVPTSEHDLPLLARQGLPLEGVGFEFARHYEDGGAVLLLRPSIVFGATRLEPLVSLPVGPLAPHAWTVSLPAQVRLNQGLADLVAFVAGTDAGQALGVDDWAGQFPARLHAIPALFLSGLEINVDPLAPRLVTLAFTLETAYPLTLDGTTFTVDRLGASVALFLWESGPKMLLTLFGHVLLNEYVALGLSIDIPVPGADRPWKVALDASVEMEDLNHLDNLPINTGVSEFHLPRGFFEMEALELRRFDVVFYPSKGIETVDLDVSTRMALRLGSALALEDPAITLRVTNPFQAQGTFPPRSITGSIRGVVLIGDIAFEVGAEKRENGWSFSGELGGLMRIGVALDAVSRHFGLTLPDALRDMELTRLRLRFATTAAPTPEPAALPTASPAPQHPAQPAASSVAGAPPSAEKAVAGAPKQAAPANAAATVAPNKGATAPAATAEAPAAGGTSTDVAFTCAGTLPVGGGEFDFTVDIEVSEQADGGYDRQVQGTLSFAGMTFSAAFGASDEASSFVAAYVAPPDDPGVGLGELARALAPEDPGLPPELDSVRLSLRDALFAYHRPKLPDGGPAPAKTLVALDAGIDVGLSALPLAGAALPPSEKLRLEFQPLFATDDFAADDLAAVGALAPSGGPALPDALPRGLTLALTLHLGGTPLRLSLPVGSRRKDKLPAAPAAAGTPADTVATTPASTSAGTTAAAPGGTAAGTVAGAAGTPPAAGGATESTVQKSAGPVQVQRVYVRYEGGDVWLYLDAALRAGKLTLALDGLGVGIPLASLGAGPLRPKFALRGVGISYASDDVEIGGFLLHLPPEAAGAADEYAGLAVIRTPRLNLSAIGSYAEVDGQRSLFLYAVLNQPIGGPAFFFVTGLAAAFGYNRALRMPALEEVARFPLVAEAVRGGPPPPASGPGQREFLMERITALRDYVPVQPGEHFFALGVRFTSFRQVDSFALLVVRVREQVEVDVLGLSTAVIPSPDPAGKAVPPLAEVQIALRATFRPAEGFLGVQGQLTPASYLFSRDCRLTGGFAFYSWFSGEHAGDFVLTLGGYHPAYRRPAHYPQVPRLAINWQVTPQLSIKGEAYFALTAGALMAGGRLQATWRSGPLTAWFTVGADFLLAWKPYHYEARAYVNVGVSYTFTLFGTHHVTAEIGADLRLWGPPFSGVAHVTLAIVSFTIQFGAPARRPVPLEWKQFRASFLPAGSGAVCGVSAAGGLVRAVPGTAAAGEVWIVNPKDLVLVTNSVIPATRAEVGGNAVTQLSFADDAHSRPTPLTTDLLFDVDGSTFPGVTAFLREHGVAFKANDSHARMRVLARRFLEVALPRPAPIPPIGIAPMQVRRGAAAATHAVRVTREDGTDATGWFTFTPVLKKAPAALWGDAFKPQLNGPSWIDGTLAGFEIRPRSPARESATHAVPRENLQYETVLAPTAVGVPAARRFVPGSAQGETHLRDRLAAEATAAARGALLSALGFDPAAAVTELDASIAGDFVVTPRSGTFAAA